MILRPVLLGLFLLSATGCVTPTPLPRAEESESFRTVEAGFHIDVREAVIRYQISLEPKVSRENPLFWEVRYENPADPRNPHLASGVFSEDEVLLFLESPPLSGLEAGKIYRVQLDLFDDAERTDRRDRHEVLIHSNIDTRSHGR